MGCGIARDIPSGGPDDCGRPGPAGGNRQEQGGGAGGDGRARGQQGATDSRPDHHQPQAQAVDPTGEESLDDAITCLARSIYWEARGEGDAGMEAIANVIMNRTGQEGFPNTICGVVKQGQEQGACQFSWWCDGLSDDATEEEPYSHAKEIARKALNRQLRDRTGGALYFHNRKLAPKWSRNISERSISASMSSTNRLAAMPDRLNPTPFTLRAY